jgi:streptogramin lyase
MGRPISILPLVTEARTMKSSFALTILGWFIGVAVPAHPASGIVADKQGRVFFTYGPSIVMIDAAGKASVLVHDAKHEKFYQLHHVFLDRDGNLLSAGDTGSGIWKVTPGGKLSRFFPPPTRIAVCASVWAEIHLPLMERETFMPSIQSKTGSRRFSRSRRRARSAFSQAGIGVMRTGAANKQNSAISTAGSMALAPDGTLFVTDDRRFVRRITKDGNVMTLAGKATRGFADGSGADAQFDVPCGLALDSQGNLFVADYGNNRIRKITPDGKVTTFAGSGVETSQDGPAAQASFTRPTGIAVGPREEIYVLEFESGRVRRISPQGQVSTLLESVPKE